MFFIVSYDTPCDKRRRKMAKVLCGYAERVQKSVFETNLTAGLMDELTEKLIPVINEDEDNLRIYEIPKDYIPKVKVWGAVPLVQEKNLYILSEIKESILPVI